MAASAPSPTRLSGATLFAVGAMALAVFVVANDITALSVALPDIERDFNANVASVQWVINGYALIFGVLIVTGGRLADLLGRRRIFFVGAAIFAGFSVLGGAAQDTGWLIASRALMGIGGALMWPAILGMTYAILPEDRAGLAGGLIIGAAGFGNAAGPLLGGVLTDALSWRWILFLNVPVALLACLVTARAVTESRGEDTERRIDYPGIATLSTGLIALLVALDQVTDWGWDDPRVYGLFAGFVLLLAAFVMCERRAGRAALVPPDVMRNRDFASACLATLLMSATFFAALLYLPQFMQKILGWSPLEAGAGLLPMMAVFAAVSFTAGPLYEKLGAKLVLSAGAACLCVGPFLISVVGHGSGYGALVPGMVVLGIGIGLFYSSVTTAAVTAVDAARASLAGGIVYMFQIAGGSIGLGLTTTIFTTAATDTVQKSPTASALSSAQQADVHGILAGTGSARHVLAELPGAAGHHVVATVRDAFTSGMHWGFRFVAVLALAGFVLTVLRVGGPLRTVRRPRASRVESPATP
jgi:EmrB/QacA subfamily drug resistance transporter